MISFSHVIADPEGLHARPVAQIAAEARDWVSEIMVSRAGYTVCADDLIGLMALDAHCGDVLEMTVSGSDEDQAAAAMRRVISF